MPGYGQPSASSRHRSAPPIPLLACMRRRSVASCPSSCSVSSKTGLRHQGRRHVAGLPCGNRKRVMDFIEEHLSEDVSLDVLADLVRLSPYHFLRSFKQSFGGPPYRYWTGRRIERAKALLANPRTSVTEIALAVGFHGTSAFSATFHRVTE